MIGEVQVAYRLGIRLKAKAYVLDVRFEKSFQTDVYVRATEAFGKHGIKRPPLG